MCGWPKAVSGNAYLLSKNAGATKIPNSALLEENGKTYVCRDDEQADKMVADALALQNAGAQIVLLECVPASLAKRITEACDVPVIGIGAGNVTDGQILVMHDMFGISANYMPKFSKNFLAETGDMRKAVALYKEEVESARFPDEAHTIA